LFFSLRLSDASAGDPALFRTSASEAVFAMAEWDIKDGVVTGITLSAKVLLSFLFSFCVCVSLFMRLGIVSGQTFVCCFPTTSHH
jgi:hypothetical protein